MRMLRIGVASLLPCLGLLIGCRALITPWLLWGKEPTKTVPAEYPYLTDKRAALVVRPEMETLFQYPQVQYELSDHIKVALEANVRGVEVVEPRKIVDFQRQRNNWEAIDPAELGRRFDAERLIEIELTQYTTRDPDSPYVYRGHVAALVNVYNTDFPNSAPAYSREVRTVYPPAGSAGWGTDEATIRFMMMQAFAEELAGKFYERRVKVR